MPKSYGEAPKQADVVTHPVYVPAIPGCFKHFYRRFNRFVFPIQCLLAGVTTVRSQLAPVSTPGRAGAENRNSVNEALNRRRTMPVDNF